MLTSILYAIMMWQQGQACKVGDIRAAQDGMEQVCDPDGVWRGVLEGAGPKPYIVKQNQEAIYGPVFDVPPVETRTEFSGRGSHGGTGGGYINRMCTDKSRFLLMSEDGKWHCLALGQKP
jgi:hypothetical protein